MSKNNAKFKPVNVEETWRRVGGNIVVSCVRGDSGGTIEIMRGELGGFISIENYAYSDELWEQVNARYAPHQTGLVTTSNQLAIYIAQHPDGDIEHILEQVR